jgi:hypothetical protein
MLAGAVKLAPEAGPVMSTTGAAFGRTVKSAVWLAVMLVKVRLAGSNLKPTLDGVTV